MADQQQLLAHALLTASQRTPFTPVAQPAPGLAEPLTERLPITVAGPGRGIPTEALMFNPAGVGLKQITSSIPMAGLLR